MALDKSKIDQIKLILMEWYGVTIFPDMEGPVAVNFLNGKKIFYAAREISTVGLILDAWPIVKKIAEENGLKKIDFIDQVFNDDWGYKKFFAFYIAKDDSIRFALQDY